MVKPWNEESKRIMDVLLRKEKVYTKNHGISSEFSRRYPEIIDNDFLDVVTTRYRKKEQKTIFIRPDNVVIIPTKKKIFLFHKIF